MTTDTTHFTAFSGSTRVASGTLPMVVHKLKQSFDESVLQSVQVFDDSTGRSRDIDWRAADLTASGHIDDQKPKRRGRPRLGVVAKEITLLPRHWDWLAAQPGGASVTLRKLVDNARRASAANNSQHEAQEACYQVMQALAGDLPGYEAALRALYAGDREGFEQRLSAWPDDVAAYVGRFGLVVFGTK